MRFTTWSTLINAFIISSVALLSRIQVANATSPVLSRASPWVVEVTRPLTGQVNYPGDSVLVSWNWLEDNQDPDATGTIFLKNDFFGADFHFTYQTVNLNSGISAIVLPAEAIIISSHTYYFEMSTIQGDFKGNNFSIE